MSDKYAVPNKLPGKTVAVLAHRRRRILQDKSVVEQKRKEHQKRLAKKKEHHKFRRAESFVMNHIKAERTSNRIKQTLLHSKVTREEDTNEKLLLVFRHAGKKVFDETTSKIFKAWNIPKRHQAVFLKNNKENQILLRLAEPFVCYGYPTIATVRELLFKKGFAMIDRKKTPIQSNTMIEEHLGEKGIICLEDIIHEIFTVGPNFERVTSFISPFALGNPKDGWQKKVSVSFKRGGEYGNRKAAINELVSRCL
ncbi:uncharacterized protein LOC129905155 [Episyrphus balteatus]|uniref:uncharacterized protein LOC129905155 n=1 Tax=Episyrphus balteatus TaxID=286459 RepID=UPI002484FD39|nr:uncharacterized protein LOC129905155 [Episyrphus balteatus]